MAAFDLEPSMPGPTRPFRKDYSEKVLTEAEMRQLERRNLVAALRRCQVEGGGS